MNIKSYNKAHVIFTSAMDYIDSLGDEIKNDYFFLCELRYTSHGFEVHIYFSVCFDIVMRANIKGIRLDDRFFIQEISIGKKYQDEFKEDCETFMQKLKENVNELTTRLADVVEEIKSNDKEDDIDDDKHEEQ